MPDVSFEPIADLFRLALFSANVLHVITLLVQWGAGNQFRADFDPRQ